MLTYESQNGFAKETHFVKQKVFWWHLGSNEQCVKAVLESYMVQFRNP
jgi:hypothetical protein